MQEVLSFSNEKNMAEAFLFNIGICVGAKLLAILHHHFLLSFQKTWCLICLALCRVTFLH